MTTMHSTTRNSRKEGAFIKNMCDEQRNTYLKQGIASQNAQLLRPFIQISKMHDRYWRKISYDIDIGVEPPYEGVTHNSRRNSNYIMQLSHQKRIRQTKEFIAVCHAQYLMPFITITGHDDKYREIHYTIHITGL